MERFSTEALVSGGKAEAWNRIYSDILAAADFIPAGKDFSAGLMLSQVGPFGLARLATGRCTIRRTAAHIDRSSPRLYSILVQTRGRGLFLQSGHRVILNPGDFALCDHAQPHSRTLEADAEMLIIRVPAEIIAGYLPHAELLCGRHLAAGAALTPAAGALVRSLWDRLERGHSSSYEDCLAHHVLDVVATSFALVYASVLGGDVPGGHGLRAIRHYIEDHLHDPDFKAGMIADGLALPMRDIRRFFAGRNESARAYLLRRRLEEAARRLRDPRWRGHTVAEIAHCCGFVSTALFARAFRERHGMTPTDYRESC